MRTFTTLLAVVLFLTVASPVFATQDPAQEMPADPIEQTKLTPRAAPADSNDRRANKHERQQHQSKSCVRRSPLCFKLFVPTPLTKLFPSNDNTELATAQAAQLRMKLRPIKFAAELRPNN